MITVADVVRFQ